MKNLILQVVALLFIGALTLNAQDDKNKSVNKNDKSVIEEHKNGGKKDVTTNPPASSDNNTIRNADEKTDKAPEKKIEKQKVENPK